MAVTKGKGRKRGHGEGSIYPAPPSRGGWIGQITLPDGRRKAFYGKIRKEVQEKMQQALADVRRGLPLPPSRLTLGTFLTDWLNEWVLPSRAAKTYRSYEQMARLYIIPELGKLPLDQVTPQRIRAMLNKAHAAGLKPNTVRNIHAVLRAALRKAVDQNLIPRNVAHIARPPKSERREVQPLEEGEARDVLRAFAGSRLEAIVTTALTLGLRQGECIGLRWSDVDLEAGRIEVRNQVQRRGDGWAFAPLKTKKSRRTLDVPPFVVDVLRTHRARQLEERLAVGPA
jgi:integrase